MRQKITIWTITILLFISLAVADTSTTSFDIANVAPPTPFDWTPTTTHSFTPSFSWNESVDINGDTIYTHVCVATTSGNRDSENCDVTSDYTDTPATSFDGSEANWDYAFFSNSRTYYVKLTPYDGQVNGTANSTISFTLTDAAPAISVSNTSSHTDTNETLDIVANIGENVTFTVSSWSDSDSDNITLRACKTDSISTSGTCDGGSWCTDGDYIDSGSIECDYTLVSPDVPTNENTVYFFICDCPDGYDSCPARCSPSKEVTFYANHPPVMEAPEISWTN